MGNGYVLCLACININILVVKFYKIEPLREMRKGIQGISVSHRYLLTNNYLQSKKCNKNKMPGSHS